PSLTTSTFSKAEAQVGDGLRYLQVMGQGGLAANELSPLPADHSTIVREERLDDVTKRQSLRGIWDALGGRLTPSITGATWDGLLDKMNLLSGAALSSESNLHNSVISTFGGNYVERAGYNPPLFPYSIDWVIEQRLASTRHRMPALRVNMRTAYGSEDTHRYSYRRWAWTPDGELPMLYDIAELENAVLGGASEPDVDTGPSAADEGNVRLIDRVKERYDALLANPRLGRADRQRLEDAVALLHEAEGRARSSLVEGPIACGSAPSAPVLIEAGRVNAGRLQDYASDLVAYALACEMTPVVSIAHFQYSDFSPRDRSESEIWHEAQHGNYSNPRAAEIYDPKNRWRLDRLAHLASRLDALEDVRGGTILDHSALFFTQEYAWQGHLHVQLGYHNIILGGAAGRLDTGNFLDLYGEPEDGDYNAPCPFNRIGVTLLHAMGHTTESIEAITGSVGFGEYGNKDRRQWELRDEPIWLSNHGRARFSSNEEKRKTLPIFRGA
ncbi:MAG: DUF1552 domain-containing protein, partial [Myxococcota bacterium]